MNCRRFHYLLYEFEEGSLSGLGKSAAERHLARCAACREALSQHRSLSGWLGEGLRHRTAGLVLGPQVQHRVLAALRSSRVSPSPPHSGFRWFWLRLSPARAVAIALLAVIAFLGLMRMSGPRDSGVAGHQAGDSRPVSVATINMAYCVPSYTFVRHASFVIDALTCESQTVNQTLWTVKH